MRSAPMRLIQDGFWKYPQSYSHLYRFLTVALTSRSCACPCDQFYGAYFRGLNRDPPKFPDGPLGPLVNLTLLDVSACKAFTLVTLTNWKVRLTVMPAQFLLRLYLKIHPNSACEEDRQGWI